MGKIRQLDEQIIRKIAAGEVVERPSAAVKEIIENSLDAGASAVTVEVREDPTDYIRVSDNGSGIDPSDIRMAFERHATSKIHQEKDLQAIETLGFRGEALSSIAAVSRVELITRTAREEAALKVINEGGVIREIRETAGTVGTTLLIRDLFYNVPVRRQFLRRPASEISLITDLMSHLILSRPDVSFRYIAGGRTVYHSPGDGKLSSAVLAVYGIAAFTQMRTVEGHQGGVLLSGYIGIGELARSTRNAENFFINRRMMFSTALSAAVENGCRERVMIGKFPMCVLHLEVPFDSVNVNVHPNKLEVRFRDEKTVCQAVTALTEEALQERDALEKPVSMQLTGCREEESAARTDAGNIHRPLPESRVTVSLSDRVPQPEKTESLAEDKPEPVFRPIDNSDSINLSKRKTAIEDKGNPQTESPPETETPGQYETNGILSQVPHMKEQTGVLAEGQKEFPTSTGAAPVMPDAERNSQKMAEQLSVLQPEVVSSDIKVFGAVFNTYILIEYQDNLLLVDQHAVHERLLFDRMMREYKQPGLGQELLIPRIVSVSKQEQQLLTDNRELLEGIGMMLEPFGETDVAVRTMPILLGEVQPADFLRDVLGDLESGRALSFEYKRTALLQCACKHAIKGGEALTEDQLRDLVKQMTDRRVTPTCPHGRPLVVAISHRELDKKFKRIQ